MPETRSVEHTAPSALPQQTLHIPTDRNVWIDHLAS